MKYFDVMVKKTFFVDGLKDESLKKVGHVKWNGETGGKFLHLDLFPDLELFLFDPPERDPLPEIQA